MGRWPLPRPSACPWAWASPWAECQWSAERRLPAGRRPWRTERRRHRLRSSPTCGDVRERGGRGARRTRRSRSRVLERGCRSIRRGPRRAPGPEPGQAHNKRAPLRRSNRPWRHVERECDQADRLDRGGDRSHNRARGRRRRCNRRGPEPPLVQGRRPRPGWMT
jgi:hypothetical protein